jgi:hypothetical protein
MSRVNKTTSGVFTNIVGNENEFPAYDTFVKIQDGLNKPSKDLKGLITEYKSYVTNNKVMFEKMASLEDLIMQMRTRDNLNPKEIKFNVVREYIYARLPFHRLDKEAKDIRVIVGLTEFYGTNTDTLYDNKEFMEFAVNKLKGSMTMIINNKLK